jgi:hypothetical protein
LISISKRVEESLPYITSTARGIPWDLIQSWVFEELDFCRVMKDIARINFE